MPTTPTSSRSAREPNPVVEARRGRIRRLAWRILGVIAVICTFGACRGMSMPGESHAGPLPPLTDAQRDLATELRRDVGVLSEDIGNRNLFVPKAYARAARFVERAFHEAGYPGVERQTFPVDGLPCHNFVATLPGAASDAEIVVLGAHYDTAQGCPGADDNATGVAGLLAIARRLRSERPDRTIRFVAFANEEPPFFHTSLMGSRVYAAACAEAEDTIVAMLSLDGIGYYSDAEDSQGYPWPFSLFYPSTGNFITFVGNAGSTGLVRRSVESFRRHAAFPSEGAALPELVPGVDWSDHSSFWLHGYDAIEVTDTLPNRYRHYHRATDTLDRLDFESMARVVEGLAAVVLDLATVPE